MKKLTHNDINEFFEDNAIEDDELHDLLLGRIGEISLDVENDEEVTLVIKLKMQCE
jgi:hypothetical protein